MLNAEDVHQSVHTVRSQTEKDLVKEPVRSMLYIWVRTNALKLTIINVFPAAHVFISAHSERLLTSPFILDVINLMKKSRNNECKLYAVVAPSISSQFSYAKLGQVVTGIKELGFHTVVEAALGADMVAYAEAAELAEKKFLTSSCCPAFVDYIHKQFPDMVEHISHNLSPMAAIAKYIKETDENAKNCIYWSVHC